METLKESHSCVIEHQQSVRDVVWRGWSSGLVESKQQISWLTQRHLGVVCTIIKLKLLLASYQLVINAGCLRQWLTQCQQLCSSF